jgi:hypothetical protein
VLAKPADVCDTVNALHVDPTINSRRHQASDKALCVRQIKAQPRPSLRELHFGSPVNTLLETPRNGRRAWCAVTQSYTQQAMSSQVLLSRLVAAEPVQSEAFIDR